MRFRLGTIPIHVHPSFLIIALLGGFDTVTAIAAWTAAAFIAVLAHELGHAWTVRAFGIRQVQVTLFGLGGVTTFPAVPKLSPGRQFLVSASGSAVGIALGGTAFLLGRAGAFEGWPLTARIFVGSLVWVGAVFGLFNWLPIRPLDGGQMLTSALEVVTPRRAEAIAITVHLLVGAGAAFLAFRLDYDFAAFFVILITLAGLNRGRPRSPQRPDAARSPSPTTAGGGDAMSDEDGAASEEPTDPFPI